MALPNLVQVSQPPSSPLAKQDADYSQQTVLFVQLANSLRFVSRHADNVELAAMNAKTFAMRAGSEGQVYRPITDFLIELARKSSILVKDIGNNALLSTNEAAQVSRESAGYARLRQAAATVHPEGRQAILRRGEGFRRQIKTLREQTEKRRIRLADLIGQFDELVRGARAVIATSRIETARLSEDTRLAFTNTIDQLEDSIEAIEKATKKGKSLTKDLEQVQHRLHRHWLSADLILAA